MPNHLRKNPWVVCLLPFVVFMVVGSLEPAPPAAAGEEPARPWLDLGIKYGHYPMVYGAKILLTLAAIGFVWPGYRQYARRVTWLGAAVGIVGGAVWIALAHLQHAVLAGTEIEWLKWFGQRSAFNPLAELSDNPGMAYGFLAVRMIGLALVVPIIEEFFLRGFVMRYVMSQQWWEVPFGTVDRTAVIVGTLLPMLMHPQEVIAAAVWFSMVTWLMTRTRSIWDCVVAHGITNLILGIYVIASGQWWLM